MLLEVRERDAPFALHQPNLVTIFMGRLDTRHLRHYSRLGVYPSSKSAVPMQPGGPIQDLEAWITRR